MNNELFDRMIKDNLNELEVVPSAGMKKALGWKLFFQNMLVFHKLKLGLGLLFIGGSSIYFSDITSNDWELNGEGISLYLNNLNSQVESLAALDVSDQNKIEIINEADNVVDDNAPSNLVSLKSESDALNLVTSNDIAVSAEQNTPSDFSDKESAEIIKSESFPEKLKPLVSNENEAKSEMTEHKLLIKSQNGNTSSFADINEDLFITSSHGVNLNADGLNMTPVQGEDLVFNKPNVLVGEFSLDIFKGLFATDKIGSTMVHAIHQDYYWDFHGDEENLQSNHLGGVKLNYTMGSGVFRLKMNTGVDYNKVNDNKANYEFHETTLAWVNTYGEDTCIQCFYTENTPELQSELEKEFNQYSYLSVPIQLGTQLNFKYASIDLLGGIGLNMLTKAKGIYIREGLNPIYEQFYYWKNLNLTTLSKDNDMLKKAYLSWNVAANVRVRLSKNFDLLAGYQINKSFDYITKNTYLMKKSIMNSNAMIGLTFYPTRLPIKPKM